MSPTLLLEFNKHKSKGCTHPNPVKTVTLTNALLKIYKHAYNHNSHEMVCCIYEWWFPSGNLLYDAMPLYWPILNIWSKACCVDLCAACLYLHKTLNKSFYVCTTNALRPSLVVYYFYTFSSLKFCFNTPHSFTATPGFSPLSQPYLQKPAITHNWLTQNIVFAIELLENRMVIKIIQ